MNPKRHIKNLQIYKKYLISEKGITLVEVIISLAILGMVFTGTQLLNHFGLVSFNKGNVQTNLQQELRIADTFITNEVRHATEIHVLEEVPENIDDKYNYIFIDDEDNIISSKGTTRKTIVDGISSLKFSGKNSDELLYFEIHNAEKKQQYKIEKQVYPINMDLLDATIGNGDKVGIGIRYRSIMPLSLDKSILMPGIVGDLYNHQFTAFGGTPPYTFSIIGLSESGLTLAQDTGIISGKPSMAGEYILYVTVKDTNLETDSYQCTLVINDPSGTPNMPPDTPIGIGNEGWIRGNSNNIEAATRQTANKVKLETQKDNLYLPSQQANFTAPEIYFENNLIIKSITIAITIIIKGSNNVVIFCNALSVSSS